MSRRETRRRSPLASLLWGLAGATAVVGIGLAAISAVVARTVVIPPSRREDDIRILRYDAHARTITLSASLAKRKALAVIVTGAGLQARTRALK